jgi:hypothetical protein
MAQSTQLQRGLGTESAPTPLRQERSTSLDSPEVLRDTARGRFATWGSPMTVSKDHATQLIQQLGTGSFTSKLTPCMGRENSTLSEAETTTSEMLRGHSPLSCGAESRPGSNDHDALTSLVFGASVPLAVARASTDRDACAFAPIARDHKAHADAPCERGSGTLSEQPVSQIAEHAKQQHLCDEPSELGARDAQTKSCCQAERMYEHVHAEGRARSSSTSDALNGFTLKHTNSNSSLSSLASHDSEDGGRVTDKMCGCTRGTCVVVGQCICNLKRPDGIPRAYRRPELDEVSKRAPMHTQSLRSIGKISQKLTTNCD